jgi:probable DNA metabolism protein
MLPEGPMIDALRITLPAEDDFEAWRDAARGLAEAGVPASAVVWQVEGGDADLFGGDVAPPPPGPSFAVPRGFVDLAKSAICHSEPERFALLYALLLKLKGNKRALEDRADPLVDRIEKLAKEVHRDVHKMHAFVRFREVAEEGGTRFVAWFEPDHHIVRHTAGFFVRRFTTMRWSILTPEVCIHWDGVSLTESPGATRADAPNGDPVEETWKTYYASIFNPARVKVKAMTKEMPKKYWKNMPETALIAGLIAGAQAREAVMIEASAAMPKAQAGAGENVQLSWDALRDEAAGCSRCELHQCATQTVFGEGPLDAKIIFVGEQPGDQEDLAGRISPDRPVDHLRDQCGQAFQIRASRQAADPRAARHFRDRRLPLVAGAGARADPPGGDSRAGGDGGAVTDGEDANDFQGARGAVAAGGRQRMLGDGASELFAADPRRAAPPRGARAVCS